MWKHEGNSTREKRKLEGEAEKDKDKREWRWQKLGRICREGFEEGGRKWRRMKMCKGGRDICEKTQTWGEEEVSFVLSNS